MCGIYITNIPFNKEEVILKLESIKFRGPDNMGYEKVGDVTIGHLRLSILDLDARSNQPYSYKNLVITFNGEIYNFETIKNELILLGYNFETTSDTEVLIKGYSEWGKELLNKLNGMFSFVIYDTEKNTIFCARDRVGVKPLYYYFKNGKFEICSQLRPLINSNSKICDEAVSIYLDCGYIPSPFSIIEDVNKLLPGNYLEINLNNNTKFISEYWDLKQVKIKKISYKKAKEELHELLIDAVKIRMQSDVNLGSFLSGGIDSALVSAIASKISNKPINTFTIGFDDPKFDESKVAAQFANIIKSNHTETVCNQKDALKMLEKLIEVYDEPFSDSSALPSLLLNSITKQHATVALSGDGGDESFFGYAHFDLMKKFNKIELFPLFIRKILSKIKWYKVFGGRPQTIKGILNSRNSDEFAMKIFTGYESLQKNRNTKWFDLYNKYRNLSNSSIQKMADLNIKLWLENDSNTKVDRASMAFSIEVRSPFLYYRIIEYARNLPEKYRYRRNNKKRILKDILSEYIPEEIFNQPKKGFSIPIGKWIREDLKEDIYFELNDEFYKKVPNLNITKFNIELEDHMNGKYDYSYNIWKMYLLAKWFKEFKFN